MARHNLKDLKGSIVALVTPFKEDGSVDFDAMGKLIDFHLENGTDAILVLGTTGESSTMSHEEDDAVCEFAVKRIDGRVPVIAGSGSNCTQTMLEKSLRYQEIGVDGLLVITPYYNKANEEGMYQHFKTVLDAVDIPCILYNVPGRTGSNIEPETVLALAKDVPNIIGIKEASGKIEQSLKIMAGRPEGFKLLSGNDEDTLELMKQGADGVISVASNVFPSAMADFIHALEAGKFDEAARMDARLKPLFKALFVEPNPIPAKAAMAQLGLMENSLRLPLVKATDATEALLKQTLKELF